MEPDDAPETESESDPETDPETESESESDPETDPETESESEPKSDSSRRQNLLKSAAAARERAEREDDAAEPVSGGPTAFRIAARSIPAGLVTELLVGAVLVTTVKLAYGGFLPLRLWVYLIAIGLLTGAVFAVAELASRLLSVAVGALIALSLVPAVALGGQFALEVVVLGSPVKAFGAIMQLLTVDALPQHAVFVSGALALYLPLLISRRRQAHVLVQIYWMAAGALVWLTALVLVPLEFKSLNLTLYLLPIVVRVVAFPILLALGDRLARRMQSKVEGGGQPAARASARLMTRTPAKRHKAKWLSEQAARQLAAGQAAQAAASYDKAYALWPNSDRALHAAKAWVAADEPYKAISKLREMLEGAKPRPGALKDEAFEPLAGLEAFEALEATPRRLAPARRKTGLDPVWTLHALAGCVGAVLVALSIVPMYSPDIPANISRLRLRSLVWTNADEMYRTGQQLEFGLRGKAAKHSTLGLAAAFAILKLPPPLAQDGRAAQGWYLRAARAGHPQAMVRYADHCRVEGDDEAATRWYREAAEAGHPHAMFCLGAALRWGRGTETNNAKALEWYRKAAEAGDVDAMVNLAFWLEVGRTIERDVPEAIRWLERAKDAGSPRAAKEIGRLRRLQQRQ